MPPQMTHFIEKFNHLNGKNVVGISREAMAVLMLYDWPGNVRELENAIEHAFVLCQGDMIRLPHLPERIVPQDASLVIVHGFDPQGNRKTCHSGRLAPQPVEKGRHSSRTGD